MKSFKLNLMSTTLVPAIVGAGLAVGGSMALSSTGQAAGNGDLLPVAKARSGSVLVAGSGVAVADAILVVQKNAAVAHATRVAPRNADVVPATLALRRRVVVDVILAARKSVRATLATPVQLKTPAAAAIRATPVPAVAADSSRLSA